jgi:hypothetical protein
MAAVVLEGVHDGVAILVARKQHAPTAALRSLDFFEEQQVEPPAKDSMEGVVVAHGLGRFCRTDSRCPGQLSGELPLSALR